MVDEILAHQWNQGKVEFHVKWNYGDATWEPYTACKDLIALDDYLDRVGVKHWRALPRVRDRRTARR